jgi:hypothetical protein
MTQPAEHESIGQFIEMALGFNPMRDRTPLRSNLHQLPNGKVDLEVQPTAPPNPECQRLTWGCDSVWSDLQSITCPTHVLRGEPGEPPGGDAIRVS